MTENPDMAEPQGTDSSTVSLTEAAVSQLEEFRRAHETQVLTILMSDLEGSTLQQSALGNVLAAQLVQTHRTVFRQELRRFDGREVETAGDSFLVVLATPSEGVKFALHMQAAMRKARQKLPALPAVRVGIHQGQVVVERHEDGAKALDIYGLQVSTAARIMDLGAGGQVLCSRAVFDDARAILRGEDFAGLGRVAWRNHGPYQFKGVQDTYDVCEVGQEGASALTAPPAGKKGWPAGQSSEELGWRPAAGVPVPQTNWVLEERLGKEESGEEGPTKYRGAFGEVWQAWNPGTKSRQVFKFCFKRDRVPALKREARLLRRLRQYRHPNLVEVYDVTEGDRPPYYLEMEYVQGPSLEEWLGANPPLAERLEVIAQVADALDTVHAAGIYHRDIKPSNILLTRRQDGTLQAKLSDFGLGAAEDKELLESIYVSRVTGVAGTWDYIAPELRTGGVASAQSDLYSLGITLYQVVVGDVRRPLTADWESQLPTEILRQDVRRCVVRGAADRWRSAAELSKALRSHDERLERLKLERQEAQHRRRARRLRAILGVVGLFAAVMVSGAILAMYQRAEALRQRQESERQREIAQSARDQEIAARKVAEERLYLSSILAASWQMGKQRYDLARTGLWQAPQRLRRWEWGYLVRVSHVEGPSFPHGGAVAEAQFGADGARLLTVSRVDGTAKVWDGATGTLLFTLPGREGKGNLYTAALSPDGSRIATGALDGGAKVWSAATGAPLLDLSGHTKTVYSVAFRRDGARIVTACLDQTGRIWDAATGKPTAKPLQHEDRVYWAQFSPDGGAIVTKSGPKTVRVWDADTGKALAALPESQGNVIGVTFSPDGTRLVTTSTDGKARVWNAASGTLLKELPHDAAVYSADFSADGGAIVTGSKDKTARVWDAVTGKAIRTLAGHTDTVRCVAFSPDGSCVVTASLDGTAKVWEVATGEVSAELTGHKDKILCAAYSPGGGRVVTGSLDGTAKVWRVAAAAAFSTLAGHSGGVRSLSFSPDGTRVVTASLDRTAKVWDASTLGLLATFGQHGEALSSAAFDPQGRRVVSASEDRTARVWDAATGEPLAVLTHDKWVSSASFNADGTRVVTTCGDGTAWLWDAANGKPVAALADRKGGGAAGPPSSGGGDVATRAATRVAGPQSRAVELTVPPSEAPLAAFSPDGTRVVTALATPVAQVWDARAGAPVARLRGQKSQITCVCFDPTGRRVAGGAVDGTTRIWNADTGAELASLPGHAGEVTCVAFSPDGTALVTASQDWTARVWDAQAIPKGPAVRAPAVLWGHKGGVVRAAFDPAGDRIVTASTDGTAKVWDAITGAELATLTGHSAGLLSAAFSPDGSRISTVSQSRDGTAKLWLAAPFLASRLPGDKSTGWRERFGLWMGGQCQLWRARPRR